MMFLKVRVVGAPVCCYAMCYTVFREIGRTVDFTYTKLSRLIDTGDSQLHTMWMQRKILISDF